MASLRETFYGSMCAERYGMKDSLITKVAIISMVCSIHNMEKGQTDGMHSTAVYVCMYVCMYVCIHVDNMVQPILRGGSIQSLTSSTSIDQGSGISR